MMNQKISELEQDIQLLEVPMDENKQDHTASIDELKEAKAQLLACKISKLVATKCKHSERKTRSKA